MAVAHRSHRPSSQHFFTPEGSVIRRSTSGLGMGGRGPSIRRILAALIAATSTWVAFAVYGEAASGRALDDRVAILQKQNETLRQQVADREREVSVAGGDAWLEEEARKLGYVMPGEHIYILTPQGQTVPAPGGVGFKTPPAFAGPSSGAPAQPSPSPAVTTSPGVAATANPRPTPVVIILPTPGAHQ